MMLAVNTILDHETGVRMSLSAPNLGVIQTPAYLHNAHCRSRVSSHIEGAGGATYMYSLVYGCMTSSQDLKLVLEDMVNFFGKGSKVNGLKRS